MSAACEVVAGSGSVARRADSLVWASDPTPESVWETLLSCLALGHRVQGAAPLLRAVAETLPADLDADVAFAVVVTDGSAGYVLRHGRVDVTLDGEPLKGDALVPVTVAGRSVAAGDPDAVRTLLERPPSTRHDLRDGAVAGAAFRWSSGTAASAARDARPAASGEPAPAAAATDPPPDVEAGPLLLTKLDGPAVDITDAHPQVTSDPEQTEFHPRPQADEPSSPDLPRSAGVLVFEDGATANLTGDVVLGRRPDRHDLVESGQAQPLVIHDPEHVLSSAHAAVRIQGDTVVVVDLDSLNGTHVAAPDARDWTKLTPGVPYGMQDGCRMLLGWTVLTYHNHPA
ncbi:MAG: FHA domain-containing protein [Geodermatophilaceae bacterium]|nr:FHA domain-containing protein [Geodermatophilaceae bacterium]MDQ3465708.1 FHA domain-containing protein [Actinomycetota bacterium]